VLIHLAQSSVNELLAIPETGMGFQLVEASVLGSRKHLLVFNADEAFDLSRADLHTGDEPATILRNGYRIIELLKQDTRPTFVSSPAPHNFTLLESRITSGSNPKSSGPLIATPSALVKHIVLRTSRLFHRFSAFKLDKRIDPRTGDFLPGTYATTEAEVPFVPTGFAAVGRFALPNKSPASHHFQIEAPLNTLVSFGTVAPAFGQAGGGVEAYFLHAVANAKKPPTPPSLIPDE
jgi:hypothetical protein